MKENKFENIKIQIKMDINNVIRTEEERLDYLNQELNTNYQSLDKVDWRTISRCQRLSDNFKKEMELKEKEMPKLCINNIEWEHLEKKHAFYASTGERILDDVNENNIENIFNILQEWDKNDEEFFQQYKEYKRRVVNNTFKICVDVVYFKEDINEYILSNFYVLNFLKVDDDIKLISFADGLVMNLSNVVCEDWERDVYPYQQHTDKLLNELYEKNKLLYEKYENDEITWVELIHSLN